MKQWLHYWVLSRGEGYVSVDFKVRDYAIGITSVYTNNCIKYTGRGWKQRLVDDAIKHLEEINDTQNQH